MSLEGFATIVVGTSPNIGAGIAVALGRAGAAVICVDRDPSYAEGCAAELAGLGCASVGRVLDATDADAVQRCIEQLPAELGPVRGLVNAAVRYDERGLLDMPPDSWREQLDVVLTSAFLFTKFTALRMIAAGGGGSIVNVASTAAHQGQPGNICYSTAKAGLLNFTRAAAMDLAPYGIRVNSLTPTSTDTSEARERAAAWGVPAERFEPNARAAERRALLPLGFAPAPSDYGDAVAFLISPAARAITGCDLRVDAGAVAKHWTAGPATPGRTSPDRARQTSEEDEP